MDSGAKKDGSMGPSKSRTSGKSGRLSPKVSRPKLFKNAGCAQDPVKASGLEEELQRAVEELALKELEKPKPKKERHVVPDMYTRMRLAVLPAPVFPRPLYAIPESEARRRAKIERRLEADAKRGFCTWGNLEVPEPAEAATIGTVLDVPSPDVSRTKLKAFPRRPSVSASQGMPEPPDAADLDLKKPKSGIYVNQTILPEMADERDSFDLVYEREPRPKRPEEIEAEARAERELKKKGKRKSATPDADDAKDKEIEESPIIQAIIEEAARLEQGEGEDDLDEDLLVKMFRRKVSQASKATSLNSKDLDQFPVFDEEDLEQQADMTRIVQKFRRDSEAERYRPPPRKILHGTLESHSFTKMLQPIAKDFYYGVVLGTTNHGDAHFPASSRGLQGMCMPIAAYCYSMLLHPNKWTELVVDDILDVGDKLYADSLGTLHMHKNKNELQYYELHKYCVIETKKLRFQVYEPEIVGQIRSSDKKVYNIGKALQIFFNRQSAGVVRSFGLNVVIWKDKHYYFFDAKGRKKDLKQDADGKAILAHVYDIPELTAIFLEHTNLGNWPFSISKINVIKIMDKDAPEEEATRDILQDRSDYNILDEHKAVIQGSFDLADLCFDFSRNKQAIAMAAVCLVYSKITPPSSWHRKTIDKIMIIGNQLYLELVESENVLEMSLENVPATFTIGPYVVDILVYANVYADVMFKKGVSMFQRCLEKFFETNTMSICFIGNFVIAAWKQRNMYYCFDPYSRNNEGLKCRNGTSCITMNANVESLANTVGLNFDGKDDIFYVHAVKVLKIHRDPAQAQLFPKTMTMDDISPETFKACGVKKSKKKAWEKTVTADLSEAGVKRLLPWDFLGQSMIEVGSGVESLTPEQMPTMVHKLPSRAMLRSMLPEVPKAIDLDSPSLSDTQIDIARPEPVKGDEIDLTAWDLTQEELEMEGGGEGEGDEDALETFMAMNQYAQVHADSLDSYNKRMSAQVNTDITVGFLPVPREILPPTDIRWKQKNLKEREMRRRQNQLKMERLLGEPVVTRSMELAKESNFVDLPDNSQIVRGSTNISAFGQDVDYMAPFVCMMASAVAQKYAVISWSGEIVDYTLRSGAKLYNLSKVRYDQVPILDVPKVSLGKSNYSILVEYLLDTVMKQRVLEEALAKVLFKKHECGLVATPSYACAVFFKNHLYYLFDCFGCNEVGLGEGPSNAGAACFARFKNVHDMATRIVFNKKKRDVVEEYEFTRFVLSSCTSKCIPPKPIKVAKKKKKKSSSKMGAEGESASETDTEEEKEPEPENKVGYQLNDGILTLQGTTSLKGRTEMNFDELKEDHFVCLCACLMVLNYPILRWDTKKVDYVVDQGRHIYGHAENLEIAEKRIIRNILIYSNFFDVIITSIKIPDWRKNKNLAKGLETVLTKRNYVLVQFPNCCYAVYKHNDFYHVFDPYPCLPTGEQDAGEEGRAGWTLFQGFDDVRKRLKSQVAKDGEHYIFYNFEVSSVQKAPRDVVVGQRILEYELDKPIKPEDIGKPFNEKDCWLLRDPIPWSRKRATTSSDIPRGKRENMWHHWDIEMPNDLYSLAGTTHETGDQIDAKIRGKQTLANLVVAIGMLEIYPLSEWTPAILDSILVCGANYFAESIEKIADEDHMVEMDDLLPSCTIYPYSFEATFIPVVEGTMFLMRATQFNLYKAIRLFLDNYDYRCGIVFVDRGDETQKRFVAFGKVQEKEYFMYDSQAYGAPMFMDRQGVSYVLRCRSLKRLLYVLVLTLRGGDFFIYEVDVDGFRAVE